MTLLSKVLSARIIGHGLCCEELKVEFKVATVSDAQEVGRLVWMLLKELSRTGSCRFSIEELQQRASDFIASGRVTAVLALQDESAIGVVTLNDCCAIYAGSFGEITEFYVSPDNRSSGVGAMLMEAAIEIAIERGWHRLEVSTPELPKWLRTANFYQQNDFEEVGSRMQRVLKVASV